MLRRFIAASVAVFALIVAGGPPVAHADVVRSGSVFVAQPQACSCITTIDGYVFSGMPYYDGSAAADSAVELWWALSADPGYQPLPPVTSISTTATVGGTVDDVGDPVTLSSYGTGSYGTGSYGTGSYGTGHRLRAKRSQHQLRAAHRLGVG